ncbi:hypothetical protein L6R52_41500 [Myxococcota bacterium]|nr:hypothetical protein [Myxococcota bacterium]
MAGLDGLDEDPARAELRRRADDFDRIEDEIELAQLLYARGANEKSAFADARTFYNAADEYRAARRAEVRAAHASVPGDSGEVDA